MATSQVLQTGMEALESTETMGSETIWNEVAAVCWPGQEDQAAVCEVWLKQGIEFDSAPQMQCFILQHLNGPCGLIAPIQALVIQQLLHAPPALPIDPAEATIEQRDSAFAAAVANALLRAGTYDRAVLVLPEDGVVSSSGGVLPALDMLYLEAADLETVHEAVLVNLEHFYSKIGVVLLLFSLVLSRGTERVREDIRADSSISSLVGGDGCCEQALVNLILAGKASNRVDGDAWPDHLCPVGFLTCEVEHTLAGCFMSPVYPVWVCHGGGHYSVLYSKDETVVAVGAPTIDFSDFDGLPELTALGSDADADAGSPPIESEDAQLARVLALSMDDVGDVSAPSGGMAEHTPARSTVPMAAPLECAEASAVRQSAPTPDDHTTPQAAKRMRNSSPELSINESSFEQAAGSAAGGEDEDLARAIALSMADVPRSSVEDVAVAALTQLQSSSPPPPIVLLEDDHLSQALALSLETATADMVARSRQATFVHYNGLAPHYIKEARRRSGLPPSTTRVVEFVVDLLGGDAAVIEVSSPEQNVNAARKIHMVLQHRPLHVDAVKEDSPFEYLVVCQPDGSMEGGARPRAPGKWRCRDCHLKVPPEWSAYNDEAAVTCRSCLSHIDVCGYCHWVSRDALPVSVRRSFDDLHAPPITSLLRRRWGKATIELERADLPKLFG